jgi:hypothetical protein
MLAGAPTSQTLDSTSEPPTRKGRLLALTFAVVALGLLGGTLFTRRARTFYCTHLAFERGAPRCVVELPAELAKERFAVLRVSTNGGRVVRAENTRGTTGSLYEDQYEAAVREWQYESGKVVASRLFDQSGNNRGTIRFSDDLSRIDTFGENGHPRSLDGVEYTRIERSLDAEGHAIKELYQTPDGRPTTNERRAFGALATYDRNGLVSEMTLLGPTGSPFISQRGWATVRYSRDANGDVIAEDYFDPAGRPVFDTNDGCAGLRMRRDLSGNELERICVDPSGASIRDAAGVAKYVVSYDFAARRTSTRNLDTEGQPTTSNTGIARLDIVYNERLLEVERRLLDSTGKGVFGPDRWATRRYNYDSKDRATEISFFDTEDLPTNSSEGYAKQEFTYNDVGDHIETKTFDASGAPSPDEDGCELKRFRYSDHLLEERSCHYANGAPSVDLQGLHRLKETFAPIGDYVSTLHFDTEGKPVRSHSGAFKLERVRDERLNISGWKRFGPDGALTIAGVGFAVSKYTFDDNNNRVLDSFFDAYGAPSFVKNGGVAIRRRFNSRNLESEVTYLGKDGRGVSGPKGWSTRRSKYDERGHSIETSFADADDKPAEGENGVEVERTSFNERGQARELAFFGADGAPRVGRTGYHKRTIEYDGQGYPFLEAYADAAGAPTAGSGGFQRVRTLRDARGQIVEYAYQGSDGRPIRTGGGYSFIRQTFDDKGRLIERKYLDESGAPVGVGAGSISRETFSYDGVGRQTSYACFASTGGPAACPGGYHEEQRSYDSRGNRTRESNLGPQGVPTLVRGVAGRWLRYDERDRVSGYAYFDERGNPSANMLGVSIGYDERDNESERTFSDIRHKVVAGAAGYARIRSRYDDRDRIIERIFLDADSRPALDKSCKCARQTWTYIGDKVGASEFFDVSGAPVKSPN